MIQLAKILVVLVGVAAKPLPSPIPSPNSDYYGLRNDTVGHPSGDIFQGRTTNVMFSSSLLAAPNPFVGGVCFTYGDVLRVEGQSYWVYDIYCENPGERCDVRSLAGTDVSIEKETETDTTAKKLIYTKTDMIMWVSAVKDLTHEKVPLPLATANDAENGFITHAHFGKMEEYDEPISLKIECRIGRNPENCLRWFRDIPVQVIDSSTDRTLRARDVSFDIIDLPLEEAMIVDKAGSGNSETAPKQDRLVIPLSSNLDYDELTRCINESADTAMDDDDESQDHVNELADGTTDANESEDVTDVVDPADATNDPGNVTGDTDPASS